MLVSGRLLVFGLGPACETSPLDPANANDHFDFLEIVEFQDLDSKMQRRKKPLGSLLGFFQFIAFRV